MWLWHVAWSGFPHCYTKLNGAESTPYTCADLISLSSVEGYSFDDQQLRVILTPIVEMGTRHQFSSLLPFCSAMSFCFQSEFITYFHMNKIKHGNRILSKSIRNQTCNTITTSKKKKKKSHHLLCSQKLLHLKVWEQSCLHIGARMGKLQGQSMRDS